MSDYSYTDLMESLTYDDTNVAIHELNEREALIVLRAPFDYTRFKCTFSKEEALSAKTKHVNAVKDYEGAGYTDIFGIEIHPSKYKSVNDGYTYIWAHMCKIADNDEWLYKAHECSQRFYKDVKDDKTWI